MAWKLREMRVLQEWCLTAASSFRHGAPTLMCTTQVPILHLWEGHKAILAEKNKDCNTYHLLRWPVLRFHVLLDAAAAAVDARCLQTFANTGDCTTWCVCKGASNKHLGKITRLISSDPLNKRPNHAEFERCGMRTKENKRQTSLLATRSPNVARHHLAIPPQPLQPPLRCRHQ